VYVNYRSYWLIYKRLKGGKQLFEVNKIYIKLYIGIKKKKKKYSILQIFILR